MKNRLLVIQPSFYKDPPDNTKINKAKSRSLIGLTLPYLASLTPPEWDVTLVDEQIEDVDFDANVDLVAITTWTINSLRAYDVAREFRYRGVPVIMGGPHTFFHSEEAAEHCDAVGIGEGEMIWERMLDDAASGKLEKVYRADTAHDLRNLRLPRYDLIDMPSVNAFRTYTVQSSRGCPFKCEFCSERFYVGERYRQRPVEDIVDEVRAIGARNVFFADSMFAGKKQRAMQLMEALIPLKIRWSTLWTTYLCLDQEFMDLAKRSGLLHVNMGMESISQDTLSTVNKNFNKVCEYEEILGSLRRRGISYSLNFVFGIDGEKPDVYPATISFLEQHKVPVAYFYILDPAKGTPLYDRMKSEDRMLDERIMRSKVGNVCKIQPENGTPDELEKKVKNLYERFYNYPSMARRLPLPVTKANIASWMLNFSQMRMNKNELNIENFDWT